MKLRGLVLLMLASLMSIGASRPMNSLVVRHAGAVVPTECEQGITNVPLSPRINVAEIPLPPEPGVAPPRGSLRDALRETQAALTRNDRAAFDAGLARVRLTSSVSSMNGNAHASSFFAASYCPISNSATAK